MISYRQWYGRRQHDAGPVTVELSGRRCDAKPLLLSLLNPSRFSSSPLESSLSLSLSLSLPLSLSLSLHQPEPPWPTTVTPGSLSLI